ncbi:unnamed protein product [Rangifer tarandus platyrhynchus]|uniref:Uncharacterized protein n=1 Tax=Rangifer tarandus platyrhynchus TaxID=3082113 RepID=A0ACB1MJP7_RANTA
MPVLLQAGLAAFGVPPVNTDHFTKCHIRQGYFVTVMDEERRKRGALTLEPRTPFPEAEDIGQKFDEVFIPEGSLTLQEMPSPGPQAGVRVHKTAPLEQGPCSAASRGAPVWEPQVSRQAPGVLRSRLVHHLSPPTCVRRALLSAGVRRHVQDICRHSWRPSAVPRALGEAWWASPVWVLCPGGACVGAVPWNVPQLPWDADPFVLLEQPAWR